MALQVLVVQHHKENRKKCTLTPLRERGDIRVEVLRPGPGGYPPFPLPGGILLRVGAPPLEPLDRALLDASPEHRLVLLDANWVKVPGMFRCLSPRGPLEERSLPSEVRTAYPRRSKLFEDPPGGLATVEAIAAALQILGTPDPTVLDGYPWAERFLELNREFFARMTAAIR